MFYRGQLCELDFQILDHKQSDADSHCQEDTECRFCVHKEQSQVADLTGRLTTENAGLENTDHLTERGGKRETGKRGTIIQVGGKRETSSYGTPMVPVL